MNYIFAALSAIFCLFLGLFSLTQKRRTKVAVLFAAYNFSNAAWNCGELFLLTKSPRDWEWALCISGFGAFALIPLVLHFIVIISGLENRVPYRLTIRCFYAASGILALLHVAGLVNSAALPNQSQVGGRYSDPGELGILLPAYMIAGMITILVGTLQSLKASDGLRRKQVAYCLAAAITGSVAISAFFISFAIGTTLFWIYAPLQVLVGFVFAYAIFQHSLLPIKIALKRILLALCISLLLAMPIVGLGSWYARHLVAFGDKTSFLWVLLVAVSAIATCAPVLYNLIVRRLAFFQSISAIHLTHELKSPIYSIQGAKDILIDELKKNSPDMGKVARYLELIQRNAERLDALTRAVLSVAAFDVIDEQDEKTNVDLGRLVEEVASGFPEDRERISIRLQQQVMVRAQEEGLRQIVQNLLSNATKYSPTGSILIIVTNGNGFVETTIVDHGVGIPLGKEHEIFDPFVRLHQNAAKGAGLGLTIAKKWIDIHAGRIWAESKGEGKGTTVTFTLPSEGAQVG